MARLTTLLFAMWLGVTVSTEVDLEKRVAGGHECGTEERLYHVKLIDPVDEGLICGGSLISPQWILTASHCYDPGEDVTALIGVHKGTLQKVLIKAPHEIFKDDKGKEHDLMLLKLSNPVGIKPVPLPDCTDLPDIGDTVQVAGHGSSQVKRRKQPGSSDTLQCADMNIVKDQVDQSDHTIFYKASLVDTCAGDSGGGVVYKNKIYGVHITSDDKILCAKSAESMDLCYPQYLKWIKDTIKKSGANAAG